MRDPYLLPAKSWRSSDIYNKNGRSVKLIGSTHIQIRLLNNTMLIPAKDLAITCKTKNLNIWHTSSSVEPIVREFSTENNTIMHEIFDAIVEAMPIQLTKQEEKENTKHLILHQGDT